METNDKEYEPNKTNLEESVKSTKHKNPSNKKQTTLTQTFKEVNNERLTKETNPIKRIIMPSRRQTRSMRKDHT